MKVRLGQITSPTPLPPHPGYHCLGSELPDASVTRPGAKQCANNRCVQLCVCVRALVRCLTLLPSIHPSIHSSTHSLTHFHQDWLDEGDSSQRPISGRAERQTSTHASTEVWSVAQTQTAHPHHHHHHPYPWCERAHTIPASALHDPCHPAPGGEV